MCNGEKEDGENMMKWKIAHANKSLIDVEAQKYVRGNSLFCDWTDATPILFFFSPENEINLTMKWKLHCHYTAYVLSGNFLNYFRLSSLQIDECENEGFKLKKSFD